MTSLLYVKDQLKEKLKTEDISFYVRISKLVHNENYKFDDINPTHEEEILENDMD